MNGRYAVAGLVALLVSGCGTNYRYNSKGDLARASQDNLECMALAERMRGYEEAWVLCMRGKGYTVEKE